VFDYILFISIVSCPVSATMIIGSFLSEIINSHQHAHILKQILNSCLITEKHIPPHNKIPQQLTPQTILCFQSAFGARRISRKLWPPCLQIWTHVVFTCGAYSKIKCLVIILALKTISKNTTQDVVSSVSSAKLGCVITSMFVRCHNCLLAKENHFNHLL